MSARVKFRSWREWPRHKQTHWRRFRAIAALAGTAVLLLGAVASAQAQGPRRLDPAECLKPGAPMLWMPELGSKDGTLSGTIRLADELRRMGTATDCATQQLRFFEGVKATESAIPSGSDTPAPVAAPQFIDPLPGPTLRARVGDIVQLTFLNQVDTSNFGDSLDRGERDRSEDCDSFGVGTGGLAAGKGYPANVGDTFPNCFHGSSTANIHFHGTHTNPNSTGDNVFLFVRPSPRRGGQWAVDAGSVEAPFKKFFADCEVELKKDILSEWPKLWSDLPSDWTQEQKRLLNAYDLGEPPYLPPARDPQQRIWGENQKALDEHRWPQYYVGAYPYCFRLPEYTAAAWPPPPGHPLKMGQAPGTHWYHAHKHGSTALNVSNGMTGAFIIEGPSYDGELNSFYGMVGTGPSAVAWTRAQPILVINQLGGHPNLSRNRAFGAQPLSVNGRLRPQMNMRPGEVQLWRIINTASRGSFFFTGVYNSAAATKAPFEWKQLAQDGVQFADRNYQKSLNVPIFLSPGNRADVLVKAPLVPEGTTFEVRAQQNVVAKLDVDPTGPGAPLFSIRISGSPPDNERQMEFIKKAPLPPPFLQDIKEKDVKSGKTLVFDTKKRGEPHQHTIDNVQFSEARIGAAVYLDTVEEWKVVNRTTADTGEANIDHPFHIHINPFQISEVFDPNAKLIDAKGSALVDPKTGKPAVDATGAPLPKYVTNEPTLPDLQCKLDIAKPDTWRDCHNAPVSNGIWWDVFPIPSGRARDSNNTLFPPGPDGKPMVIPGYFKMRSRFVDYPGLYVLHCHILAHEDRGMMTIVQVTPLTPLRVKHH